MILLLCSLRHAWILQLSKVLMGVTIAERRRRWRWRRRPDMVEQDGVLPQHGHVGEAEGDRRQRVGDPRAPEDARVVPRWRRPARRRRRRVAAVRERRRSRRRALLPAGHRLPNSLHLRGAGR